MTRAWMLPLLACVLVLMAVWAMGVGSSRIGMFGVVEALFGGGSDRADLVVTTVRLPRVIAAAAVGAALAAAGAIMQAATANPLAEPGLLGVNAGAAFGVVLAIAFLGIDAPSRLIWAAFLGAAAAATTVTLLGSTGGGAATPVRLVLAGVIITSFLGSLTASILILDAQTLDAVRLWTAGSLAGRRLGEVLPVLPYLLAALLIAILTARHFTTMSLGTDAARGIGQHAGRWRAAAALLVVGLAGSAVALAGPVGFVGLLAPHLARRGIGGDYTYVLPFAALIGAALTLFADTAPRAFLGSDVPVGITLALIGAPFLVWLAARRSNR